MTKVYELRKRFAAYFETKYCGIVVEMPFTIGAGSSNQNRAELVVTDKFTQDAIEHDPRFGKQFYLAASYGEDETTTEETPAEETPAPKKAVAKKPAAKKVARKTAAEKKAEGKVFSSLNDAIYYLEEELGLETTDDNIETLLKDNNITIKEK